MVGSATSSFYHDLSMVYARSALQPETMQHTFAVVEPGGRWRVGPSLNNLGASVRISEFLNTLERPDLVVPYMFDRAGMTSFRSFFEDVLGIPVVGSEAGAAAMAADKAITKTVVGAAGVRVPRTFASALTPPTIPSSSSQLARTTHSGLPSSSTPTSFAQPFSMRSSSTLG